MTARDIRRDALFDLLVANPNGITVNEMMDQLGWSHRQCNDAVHDLRLFFADTSDTINVTCDPQGSRQRWLYTLVGSLAKVRGWTANRLRDSESRIRTMQSVMHAVVTATNARTVEGQKARVMERGLRRLIEDLDTLAGDIK